MGVRDMVNPDKGQVPAEDAAKAASEDAVASQAAEIAVELTEASDFADDASLADSGTTEDGTAEDEALDATTSPDAGGDQPRAGRKITGALTSAGSSVARRSSGLARRTTDVAGRRTQAVGRRTQALAAAAGRSSRAAGQGGRSALTWLAGQVIAMGPRLRIRDQATLRVLFPGRDDQEIARLLIERAARASAAVGGTTGAWSALPVLPAFPAEIAAETLAVVGIEIKLVGELHEILGVPAPGNAVERGRAYIGAWAHRRGVYAVPGGLLLVAGSPLARQLRRRLAGRVGRSTFSLGPLLTGALAGAMINRRETRKLGKDILEDLRRHQGELAARG
jgi:hypothetical protein